MRALLLAALVAAPACAQEAMDAAKFGALVEGRSLAWSYRAQAPYGMERYFSGQRVLWLNTETRGCVEGKWWEEAGPGGPAICFAYDNDPLPHCWNVAVKGATLTATPQEGGDPIQSTLGPAHGTPFGCGPLGY